jgi:hypothetical protein
MYQIWDQLQNIFCSITRFYRAPKKTRDNLHGYLILLAVFTAWLDKKIKQKMGWIASGYR